MQFRSGNQHALCAADEVPPFLLISPCAACCPDDIGLGQWGSAALVLASKAVDQCIQVIDDARQFLRLSEKRIVATAIRDDLSWRKSIRTVVCGRDNRFTPCSITLDDFARGQATLPYLGQMAYFLIGAPQKRVAAPSMWTFRPYLKVG